MAKHIKSFKYNMLVVMMASIGSSIGYAEIPKNDRVDQRLQLETVVLTAQQQTDVQLAKKALEQVPGGTNLLSAAQREKTTSGSNEELLALQPGIYAKSAGNEGTKISIRGSGINRAPGAHASGLYVLLDDIPFTGPGGTPYELLEPLWLNRVEIFRGANGFDKGSLALGGAINYVTKTGKDAAPLQLRYEMGSRGFQKYALSSGQKINDFDYYISANAATYDGYQQHGEAENKGIAANIGYQIRPDLETRFYLRYRETEHQTAGRLTKQQIQEDPTAANLYNLQYDAKRIQPGSTWLANQTTWNLQHAGTLQTSLAYHDYPMDLQESKYRTKVKYSDISASFSYLQPYDVLGMNSVAKVLLRSTTHRPDTAVTESLRFDANGYDAGTISRKYTYRGSDNVIQLSNEAEIQADLWLTTGLAGIYTKRASEVYYPVTNEGLSESDWDFAPRLGLRYMIDPDLQVYGNITQSIEPPHPWSLIWGSNQYFLAGSGPAAGRMRAPIHLDQQKALTFEIGGRGDSVVGLWDLSYYYAQVKNELLSVEISPMPNPVVAESNASPTIHQGAELGLNSVLLSQDGLADLSLLQSYTYSDFKYKNDVIFGGNQLPGLPKHFYQAQLRVDFDNGMFASVNTEYAAKMPVDYANSFYSDAYQTWGLSLGYQPDHQQWHTWIDFKNLGDKHYAATVTPGYNDKGLDMARSTPGEGFSTYAGIAINF